MNRILAACRRHRLEPAVSVQYADLRVGDTAPVCLPVAVACQPLLLSVGHSRSMWRRVALRQVLFEWGSSVLHHKAPGMMCEKCMLRPGSLILNSGDAVGRGFAQRLNWDGLNQAVERRHMVGFVARNAEPTVKSRSLILNEEKQVLRCVRALSRRAYLAMICGCCRVACVSFQLGEECFIVWCGLPRCCAC